MAKDPVCGMDVDPGTAQHKSEYQGQTLLLLRARLQAGV
jgi:YHS domain-containing protein